MKNLAAILVLMLTAVVPAWANVIVSSPRNLETVSPSTKFVASGTTTCFRGVAAIGVYIDGNLAYMANGARLNTSLTLSVGKHTAAVEEWDFCGWMTKTTVPINVATSDSIWVVSPANQSTVSTAASFVATATSTCPSGVTAMGVYVNNQLAYQVKGASLDTQISLPPGLQHTVVQAWDGCGGASTTPLSITATGPANKFTNIQATPNWYSWGQLAPTYEDCSFPCTGVTWSMKQGIKSPSLSGTASQVNLAGTAPYSDVLYANHLIGPFSTQGLPDPKQTILPTLHNFSYDADFYVTDPKDTQAVEFDINWFMNSIGMTWGTECRIRGGNEWDIWNNAEAKWVATGIACNPVSNGWNHVTVSVQRTADNKLLYQSITLNGVTSVINQTYAPFTVPADWYGITVNYQLDGDENMTPISTYIDNLDFTDW